MTGSTPLRADRPRARRAVPGSKTRCCLVRSAAFNARAVQARQHANALARLEIVPALSYCDCPTTVQAHDNFFTVFSRKPVLERVPADSAGNRAGHGRCGATEASADRV